VLTDGHQNPKEMKILNANMDRGQNGHLAPSPAEMPMQCNSGPEQFWVPTPNIAPINWRKGNVISCNVWSPTKVTIPNDGNVSMCINGNPLKIKREKNSRKFGRIDIDWTVRW
jgi:hypothetical protein